MPPEPPQPRPAGREPSPPWARPYGYGERAKNPHRGAWVGRTAAAQARAQAEQARPAVLEAVKCAQRGEGPEGPTVWAAGCWPWAWADGGPGLQKKGFFARRLASSVLFFCTFCCVFCYFGAFFLIFAAFSARLWERWRGARGEEERWRHFSLGLGGGTSCFDIIKIGPVAAQGSSQPGGRSHPGPQGGSGAKPHGPQAQAPRAGSTEAARRSGTAEPRSKPARRVWRPRRARSARRGRKGRRCGRPWAVLRRPTGAGVRPPWGPGPGDHLSFSRPGGLGGHRRRKSFLVILEFSTYNANTCSLFPRTLDSAARPQR